MLRGILKFSPHFEVFSDLRCIQLNRHIATWAKLQNTPLWSGLPHLHVSGGFEDQDITQ